MQGLHSMLCATLSAADDRQLQCRWLQERKRRKQAVRLDKVTNAHMPELFAGEAPSNIDER